jgi:nucleoredoxin
LSRFYENCAKEGKLEIIYVSSDRTVESFAEYYGKMPWLAIPSDAGCAEIKNNLAQLFQIAGIPSTIVLNAKTGHYITDNARNAVTEIAHGPKEKGMELIETWNGMESVPLEEAAQKRQRDMPAQNPILAIIMAILRNPMYLIGLMYLYKYVKRTYFSQTIEDDSAESALAGAAAEDLTEDASPADSEF